MGAQKPWRKAVLVYPEFDSQDTFWSYGHGLKQYLRPNQYGRPKSLLPPLGLLGLYRYLRDYYETVLLVDQNVDPRPLADVIQDAEHVYIGGMLAQIQHFLAAATLTKQSGATLIVGGTAVSPDSPLLDIADHAVENEAESVIAALLEGLADGTAQKYYRGTPANPDQFFLPDYSAVNVHDYVHMALQISRGCPEACEFCDIPNRFGKASRTAPKRHIEAAFRQLYNLGWDGPVFIVDDNFIGNPRKALTVLHDLYDIGERIGYHHPKYTEMSLRLADATPIMAELRAWLKRTGFSAGFYGVETPNPAALRETHKWQNLRGELPLAEKLRQISEQTGTGVMMGMIFGFDSDDEASLPAFIDFVNSTHAPIVMVGLLNALPETSLMRRLQLQGRFLRPSSRNNSDGIINFIPYQFSVAAAERHYLRIIEAIYRPDAYFQRVMRHLQWVSPGNANDSRSRRGNLALAAKILSKSNAWRYWRHLPLVHAIAKRRFGYASAGYRFLLAEYLSLCGQYTHFQRQTENQARRIRGRQYAPWQLLAWKDILSSPSLSLEVLETASAGPLYDSVRLRLHNGFVTEARRAELLLQFAYAHISSCLNQLPRGTPPSDAQLLGALLEACRIAASHRPELLGTGLEPELMAFLQSVDGLPQLLRQQLRSPLPEQPQTQE